MNKCQDYSYYIVEVATPLNPKTSQYLRDKLKADGFIYSDLSMVDFNVILPNYSIDLFMEYCKKYTYIRNNIIYINLFYYDKIKKAWPYDITKNVRGRYDFCHNYYSLKDVKNIFKCVDIKIKKDDYMKYKDEFYFHFDTVTYGWESRLNKKAVNKMMIDFNVDKEFTYDYLKDKYVYSRNDIIYMADNLIKNDHVENHPEIFEQLNKIANDKAHKIMLYFNGEDMYCEQDKVQILSSVFKIPLKTIDITKCEFSF